MGAIPEGGPCGFGGEGGVSRSFGRVNRREPCGFGEKREDHVVLGEKGEDHAALAK